MLFDGADDESGEIVFAGRIKIGHLGGFAADQRAAGVAGGAAHAFDHLFDDAPVYFSHGQVIEEKKRLGSLGENVVDAVIHDVRADGGMHARGEGDFQFGADAVGAGDQNGIAPALAIELKERAKAADGREHAVRERAAGHGGDAPLGLIGSRDIYSCIGVAHEWNLLF